MLIPGEWYLGVPCAKCRAFIHALHDKSRGEKPAKMSGPGRLVLACPSCGHEAEYRPADFKSREYKAKH